MEKKRGEGQMQCLGKTEKNQQCKRSTKEDSMFCYQHQESKTKPIKKVIKTNKPKQKLGSGAYGCVFRPPLACLDNEQYNQECQEDVMKVRDPTEDSEDIMSAKVRSIDPDSQYFLPLNGKSCRINLKSSEVKNCSALDEVVDKSKVRGYFCKYGGQTLTNYLKQNKLTAQKAWEWLCYLFRGLQILHAANIFHADIKTDNIVLHENKPKLIDFGNSFSQLPIDRYDSSSNRPAFLNAMSPNPITEMYSYYEDFYKQFGYVPNTTKDPLLHYLRQYKTDRTSYKINIVRPNLGKIDIYQVIWLFHDELDLTTNKKQDQKILAAFKTLFLKNLNPDVDKCWTLEENVQFIEKSHK